MEESQKQNESVATKLAPLLEVLETPPPPPPRSSPSPPTLPPEPHHHHVIQGMVKLLSSAKNRSAIVECIKSPKFHKNHARRLFSALGPPLLAVIEEERYVPASVFEDDADDVDVDDGQEPHGNPNSNSNRVSTGSILSRRRSSDMDASHNLASTSTSTSTSVTPDQESTQAMHFMKYTAALAQAYLTNLVSRRTNNTNNDRKVHDILKEAWDIIDLLHSTLFLLHSCGTEGLTVQTSILTLCERYWNAHFLHRDEIITQLLPLLVLKTLNGNATRANLKRLWNIRHAFTLLNFHEDDTILTLKSLLLKTASSPLYVKNVEGRKMMAFLFVVDETGRLARDLHRAIKAQIPLAKRVTLEYYGDVYVRAWRESVKLCPELDMDDDDDEDDDGNGGEDDDHDDHDHHDPAGATSSSSTTKPIQNIRATMEQHILQDLMYASIHIASPHMATSIRTILEPIHPHAPPKKSSSKSSKSKSHPQIEQMQMLYRLYTPILWRSLSAANPLVRIHASTILSRTFPLRDPTLGKIHLKHINDKTVMHLLQLLNDDDPKVRVGGCEATIYILGVYWDVLSSQDIRSLLHPIVTVHARDASSAAVRGQAVRGIVQLLDAPQSHGVLRPLLPLLGDLIHDRVERVRLATVKLLLKLKKIRGFKYYHTVPSNHLLSRLAMEGENDSIGVGAGAGVGGNAKKKKDPVGPVASALTDLLSNSYFPQGVKGSEQMRRTLLFLEHHPKAARVFYSNIGYLYDIRSTSKLIVMLMKTLQLAKDRHVADVMNGSKKKRTRRRMESSVGDDDDEEDNDDDSDGVVASNTTLMSGIAQTLLTLLTSIAADLEDPENEVCLQFIQEGMNGAFITELCMHFESMIEQNRMVDDDDDDDEYDKSSIVKDCNDICASLLGCAGFVTPDNRKILQSQLSDRLKDHGNMSRNDRNLINVIPYLAVFCSWGMQEEVSKSLSSSINSTFTNLDEMESSPQFSPVPARKGKRKQSSNKPKSEVVPKLPGDMGLRVIAQVLRGRDPSSLAIRDALVSSENACMLVLDALEKATIAAEALIHGNRSMATNVRGDENALIELVVSACECFGRLILHKEAFHNETLDLSPRAASLLRWLTKRAVPSLLSKKSDTRSCSPFRDLNLSRISSIGVRHSISPTPLSPLAVPPPRRRSNLKSTPSKVDSSFVEMESRGGKQFVLHSKTKGSTASTHIMVLSLLKSAMNIFTDWLLLGGKGEDDIIQSVNEWKQIYQCDDNHIEGRAELFPYFCRFGAVVAKQFSKFDILVGVITSASDCGNSDGTEECLKKAISFLLSAKSTKHAKTMDLVNALLDKISENDEVDKDEVTTIHQFLEKQSSGIRVALKTIMASDKGLVSLTETLSKRLTTNGQKAPEESVTNSLLVLICHEYARGSMKHQLKDSVMRHIDAGNEEFESLRETLGVVA